MSYCIGVWMITLILFSDIDESYHSDDFKHIQKPLKQIVFDRKGVVHWLFLEVAQEHVTPIITQEKRRVSTCQTASWPPFVVVIYASVGVIRQRGRWRTTVMILLQLLPPSSFL